MNIVAELKRMGWKDDQIATATIGGVPVTECKESRRRSDGWPGFRSKWEALYAMELDSQKAAGEIVDWAYEPITFHLTEASVVDGKKVRSIRYTPDFICWLPDGRRRCIEIKGFRRTKDTNRFKVAKDKYRCEEFVMFTYERGGWARLPL